MLHRFKHTTMAICVSVALLSPAQGFAETPPNDPPPLPWLVEAKAPKKMEVISIKLLHTRPSGGGVQPFKVRDVRNEIDPLRRIEATVTCPDDIQYPAAGKFARRIALLMPPANGYCSLARGPTGSTLAAFEISNISGMLATITGRNGWVPSTGTLTAAIGSGSTNNFTITRGGVTYDVQLDLEADGAGGGNVLITVFNKL